MTTANPSGGLFANIFSNEYGVVAKTWPHCQWLLESNMCCRCIGLGSRNFRALVTTAIVTCHVFNFICICIVIYAMLLPTFVLPLAGDDTYAIGLRHFRYSATKSSIHAFNFDCPNDTTISINTCNGCHDVTEFPFIVMVINLPLVLYAIWKQLQRCTPFGDYNCAKCVLTTLNFVLFVLNTVGLGMWFQMCYKRARGTIHIKEGAVMWILSLICTVLAMVLNCYLGTPIGRQDSTEEVYFVSYLMKSVLTQKEPEVTRELTPLPMEDERQDIGTVVSDAKDLHEIMPSARDTHEIFVVDKDDVICGKVVEEDPNKHYVYVDQTGNIQGPQPLEVLRRWHQEGKVPPTLIVRRVDWNSWSTLPTVLWGSGK